MRTRSAPYIVALAAAVVVLLSALLLLAAPAPGLRAELFGGIVFVLIAQAAHFASMRSDALAPTQPSA